MTLPIATPPSSILGTRTDVTSYEDATDRILAWAAEGSSRYVCAANVHMIMQCFDDPDFQQIVNAADLTTPDGVPLVWTLRMMGRRYASRVYGPSLMLHVCEQAAARSVPVGFYGGQPDVLESVVARVTQRFHDLRVVYRYAPPFRPATKQEDEAAIAAVKASGARILFVGLGCPKQERWMAAHRDRLPVVQLGVGAAFDFHGGRVRQAPTWLQELGMEWAFRLAMEPRRLWRRYLYNNPRFTVLVAWQLLRMRSAVVQRWRA